MEKIKNDTRTNLYQFFIGCFSIFFLYKGFLWFYYFWEMDSSPFGHYEPSEAEDAIMASEKASKPPEEE
jgi:hypothetical protein